MTSLNQISQICYSLYFYSVSKSPKADGTVLWWSSPFMVVLPVCMSLQKEQGSFWGKRIPKWKAACTFLQGIQDDLFNTCFSIKLLAKTEKLNRREMNDLSRATFWPNSSRSYWLGAGVKFFGLCLQKEDQITRQSFLSPVFRHLSALFNGKKTL